MGKKEFVAVVLGLEYEIFIVYIASLSFTPLVTFLDSILLNADVHPFYRPQISGLIAKKASTKIHDKYVNFADVFSLDLASKLRKHTGINNYAIKLVDGQQPPYERIYSLELVELEILKIYIETNLANRFIKPSKSPANTPIFFDQKSDSLLRLCIDYQGFNNLTIKNQYPLLLIGELLDRLGRARQFTKLNLTSIYHSIRICKRDKWKTTFRT